MKLLDCRKATKVRKRKQARRESRTILRFASLLSRRIIVGRRLGEYAFSLSTKLPIMPLYDRWCGSWQGWGVVGGGTSEEVKK